MNLPEDSYPIASQNIHDETLNSKPCATTTNNSNHTNENIILLKTITAPFTTKNKKQEPISDLVTSTNTRNYSVNNNTDHEVKDDNGQNTIYNHRIEHSTTATVINKRFTTKYALDIRSEKHNSVINLS